MPDLFHLQTHKDQLSQVEVLETKVKQADEVRRVSYGSKYHGRVDTHLADIQYRRIAPVSDLY